MLERGFKPDKERVMTTMLQIKVTVPQCHLVGSPLALRQLVAEEREKRREQGIERALDRLPDRLQCACTVMGAPEAFVLDDCQFDGAAKGEVHPRLIALHFGWVTEGERRYRLFLMDPTVEERGRVLDALLLPLSREGHELVVRTGREAQQIVAKWGNGEILGEREYGLEQGVGREQIEEAVRLLGQLTASVRRYRSVSAGWEAFASEVGEAGLELVPPTVRLICEEGEVSVADFGAMAREIAADPYDAPLLSQRVCPELGLALRGEWREGLIGMGETATARKACRDAAYWLRYPKAARARWAEGVRELGPEAQLTSLLAELVLRETGEVEELVAGWQALGIVGAEWAGMRRGELVVALEAMAELDPERLRAAYRVAEQGVAGSATERGRERDAIATSL